ncbi:MAG: thiamine phosphate synthase, partial [Chloroflexi bacterium]|nr:thiamine phosphate synthase [Chloroflexota bacterium]
MARAPSLSLPCLALVTDRTLCEDASLIDKVGQAVAGGVTMVQLREKDLAAGALLALGEGLRRATAGRALFLVNDRLDVALAAAADGVHLPENGLPAPQARR